MRFGGEDDIWDIMRREIERMMAQSPDQMHPMRVRKREQPAKNEQRIYYDVFDDEKGNIIFMMEVPVGDKKDLALNIESDKVYVAVKDRDWNVGFSLAKRIVPEKSKAEVNNYVLHLTMPIDKNERKEENI